MSRRQCENCSVTECLGKKIVLVCKLFCFASFCMEKAIRTCLRSSWKVTRKNGRISEKIQL